MVEHLLAKEKVAGSSPAARSIVLIILILAVVLASLACSDAAAESISLAEDPETITAPTSVPTVQPLIQTPTPVRAGPSPTSTSLATATPAPHVLANP